MRIFLDNGKGQGAWGDSLDRALAEWRENFGARAPREWAVTHDGIPIVERGSWPGRKRADVLVAQLVRVVDVDRAYVERRLAEGHAPRPAVGSETGLLRLACAVHEVDDE